MSTCNTGHEWFTLGASQPCYIDNSGVHRLCRCPFSTCVAASDSTFGCRLTPLAIGACAILLAIWWISVIVYMRIEWKVRELQNSLANAPRFKDPSAILFPRDVQTEQQSLTSAPKGPDTVGGTFTAT